MLRYCIVPQGQVPNADSPWSRSIGEAKVFAEGEKIRTGNDYNVVEMRTICSTHVITPREAAKMAAEIQRKQLLKDLIGANT